MKTIDNILWQVKYLQKQNWLKAKELLNSGLEQYPKNRKLLFALAKMYQNKKLYKKAIDNYQTILESHPDDDSVLFQISNCFLFLKEYRLSLDYLNRTKTEFPALLYNKAYAYSKVKDIDSGIEVLKKIHKYKVKNNLPYIFLAELYFMKKRYKEALELLDIAEKSFGKKGAINYLRGLIHVNKNNYLKAYVEFQLAEKLKVRNANFYRNYSRACQQIGKNSKAIDVLRKSIRNSPFQVDSYIELIKLYLKLDLKYEAYALAEQALKNSPYSVALSILYNKIKKTLTLDDD